MFSAYYVAAVPGDTSNGDGDSYAVVLAIDGEEEMAGRVEPHLRKAILEAVKGAGCSGLMSVW